MNKSQQSSGSISNPALTFLILVALALLSAAACALVVWKGRHGADQATVRSFIPMPYHQAFGRTQKDTQ